MASLLSARRTACDRCRSQKLRCLHDTVDYSQGPCRRCSKAGASCVTNASARIGRIPGAARRQQSRLHEPEEVLERSSTLQAGVGHRLAQAPTPASTVIGDQPDIVSESDTVQVDIQTSTRPLQATGETHDPGNLATATEYYPVPERPSVLLDVLDPSRNHNLPPPLTAQEERERKLAGLHSSLVLDLNIARGCQTADKCATIINMPEFSQNYNFLIGRMLNSSAKFVEILYLFVPSPETNTQPAPVHCDLPTLLTVFTCYIYLRRIYRYIFMSILKSVVGQEEPSLKLPSLFPGLHLGGYSLESHPDLQVKMLVEVSERMLAKVDFAIGWNCASKSVGATGLLAKTEAHGDLLSSMLERELVEQHDDGILKADSRPISEIFLALKAT